MAVNPHEAVEVVFEPRRRAEFEAVLGKHPRWRVLAQDAALRAHEGPVFLERGLCGSGRPTLLFTSKPYSPGEEVPSRNVVSAKALVMDNRFPCPVSTVHTSADLANGATLGWDGRVYVCLQGGEEEVERLCLPALRGHRRRCHGFERYLPAGIYSFAPEDPGSVAQVTARPLGREDRHYNSPNDVVVRSDGTVWFTDPPYASKQTLVPEPQLGEWVWCYDPETDEARVVADGIARPNGIVFSPDERTLYVTDTGQVTGGERPAEDPKAPRTVYAFDVTAAGLLANRRLVYVSDAGVPDGIKVDTEGRLYLGCGDGVHVLGPPGEGHRLLGKIRVPPVVGVVEGGTAQLCFGRGAYANTLFLLAEQAVIAVDLCAEGAPVGEEAGTRAGGPNGAAVNGGAADHGRSEAGIAAKRPRKGA